MTTKEVQGWKPTDWDTKLRYAKPSGGGAVGVVFCWVTPANAGSSPSTASFVIKPMSGTAAPTKFAEHVLGKIGNAVSPNSKPVLAKSPEGMALLNALKIFRLSETEPGVKKRWAEVIGHYSGADHFLIQDLQSGIKEFGDEYREEGGLMSMLMNQALMTNLGRLFAADAFIGNGDRFFKVNTGNIVFRPDGTLCSIDSTTVLTNFHSVLHEVDKYFKENSIQGGQLPATPRDWGTDIVSKHGGIAIPTKAQQQHFQTTSRSPALPPSFGMSVLFDVDTWWRDTFRGHLEKGLNTMKPPIPSPPDRVWGVGLLAFRAGVEQGLKEVDAKLSGFDWLKMKSKYNSYVRKYGGDANLDWTNFKARRLYFKARRSGQTEEQALAAVQEYSKKKLPG